MWVEPGRRSVAAVQQPQDFLQELPVIRRLGVLLLQHFRRECDPGRPSHPAQGRRGGDQHPVLGIASLAGGSAAAPLARGGPRRSVQQEVASTGAPDAEVDAIRVHRIEEAELLDNR